MKLMFAKNVGRFLIFVSVVILSAVDLVCDENRIDLLKFKIDLLYKKYQLTGNDKVKESLITEINRALDLINSSDQEGEESMKAFLPVTRSLGMKVAQSREHLEVVSVVSGKNADKAGIEPGDVILEVIGIKVRTIEELEKILNSRSRDSVNNFLISRKGKSMSMKVKY